ncbi:MAG: hypothetical protein Kow0020_03470 [Wenzhouxiangellaceae bacterium]
MMTRPARAIVVITLLLGTLLAAGCASWRPDHDPPRVNLQAFRMLTDSGTGAPGFEIELQVINPNPEPLRLAGISYSIRLDGQRLVDGVANELPVIDGYDTATVTLKAGVNLLGGIRLLNQMMQRPQSTWDYEFEAKLDPEGLAWPIRIRERGQVALPTGR